MRKRVQTLSVVLLFLTVIGLTAYTTRRLTCGEIGMGKTGAVTRVERIGELEQENSEMTEHASDAGSTDVHTETVDGEDSTTEASLASIDPFDSAVERNATRLICCEDLEKAPVGNGNPYYIKVNRTCNVVTIYGLDAAGYYRKPVKACVCSVGRNNATPTGTFYTSDKHEWGSLVGGVWGQYAYRIDGHIMFHSVPYLKQSGDSLEAVEYNKLGEAASLGCVRLTVADAKWIYENCPAGTMVTIYDDEYAGPLGKPVAEKIDTDSEEGNWDPTDPAEDNPYRTQEPRICGAGIRCIERGYTYQPACGVTALDVDGEDITAAIKMEGFVNALVVGSYPVTYSVEDAHGHKTVVESAIQVIDTKAPEIRTDRAEIPLNKIQVSEANLQKEIGKQVEVYDLNVKMPDRCLEVDFHPVGALESGRYTAGLLAKDEAGNVSETRPITLVVDMHAPEILEPENKTYEAQTREELETALREAITVTDDYSGVRDVRISWVYSTGSYHVLVTAEDQFGNVATSFLDGFDFHGDFEQ